MVTHDMAEAVLLADRIVVLKAGRIAADGAPGELLAASADPMSAPCSKPPGARAERLSAKLAAPR
jgi:osmoprotectant transport system ATP-binding protein